MSEHSLDVERDEGDPIGVTVDDRLMIVKVVAGSLADGHICVGDQIKSVNGISVTTKDAFFHKLKFAFPRLRLVVSRPAKEGGVPGRHPSKEEAAPAKDGTSAASAVPAELEKFLRRRTGFDYVVANFDWPAQQDRQLGIVLANRMHRVMVGNLKAGSLGEEMLKVLDRVVAINGTPVSDKDIAKHLIVGAGGKFSALIERPLSDEAKAEYAQKKAEGARPDTAPSPSSAAAAGGGVKFNDVGGDTSILPYDCLIISKTVRETAAKTPLPGILRQPQLTRTSSQICISKDPHKEHAIGRDTPEGKRLRSVKPL